MPREDLTKIVFLLDSTGSMSSIRHQVPGMIDEFVQDQTTGEGNATFTLVSFNSNSPQNIVYKSTPIDKVPKTKGFRPTGMTPLLHSLGKLIMSTDAEITKTAKSRRPGKVVFVVLTDGYENYSQHYDAPNSYEDVSKLVEEKKDSGWQFIFLGADIDAFQQGGRAGFNRNTTVNTTKDKLSIGTKLTSEKIKQYRKSGSIRSLDYSDEERRSMV